VARQRGRRGAGTIVKRGSRYQAQWSSTEGGHRVRHSASFTLRNDAEWWLREAARTGAPPNAELTVAEYLEGWLDQTRPFVRGTTIANYAIHVHKWIDPSIGHVSLIRLNREHCQRIVDAMQTAGRSPRTIQAALTTLKMALSAAVVRDLVDRNVAERLRAPRRFREDFITTDEHQAREIIAAFASHPLEPVIVVAIGTGMRLGEILALRWTDIVGDVIRVTGSVRPEPKIGGGRELVRTQPKTNRSIRAVRVPDTVVEVLAEHRRRQAERGLSEKVFPGRGDAWRDPTAVRQGFQRVLAAHGLRRMRFHDLRHAYATIMLAADVPLRTISEQLGHTSIALTANIYAHVLPEAKREALKILDRAIRRA